MNLILNMKNAKIVLLWTDVSIYETILWFFSTKLDV